MAAGVCGGLAEYFGLDPVLFRVLFATTAFFGGAGVIAYLIAWAVIPEAGTSDAPLDRFVLTLRRRHVPVWLVAAIGTFVIWALLFSWWAPWPFAPVIIAVVLIVVAFSRRTPPVASPVAAPVAVPGAPGASGAIAVLDAGETAQLPPVGAAPDWLGESRARSRARRHRAAPVRWATLAVLAVAMAALALADVVAGIVIPAYLWTTAGILLGGLIIGLVLRRTPWSLAWLLVPVLVVLIALGGTRASLSDGSGRQIWVPSSAADLQRTYRLAFGEGVLDLSNVSLSDPAHTSITMAAGHVRILVPAGLNVQVHADVRFGQIEVDGTTSVRRGGGAAAGYGLDLAVPSPAATGAPLTVTVHLANGNVSVEHLH